MDTIKILQSLLDSQFQQPFHGTYLWKYVEYEMTSGIITDFQDQDKNMLMLAEISDKIPEIPKEMADKVKKLLDELPPKEILFCMIPNRREYQGKGEHTALDSFIEVINGDKYLALESDICGEINENIIKTKNHLYYSFFGVMSYYGWTDVDREKLIEFVIQMYINPIEQAFQIKFPREVLRKCIFKLSAILKYRSAHLAFFQDVIKKVNPKVVVYTHGTDYIMCFVREAAQILNVPTVEIDHGSNVRNLIYPDSLGYADYLLAYSDLLTDMMREKGLKKVYAVGKPSAYIGTESSLENKMGPIVISFISSLEKDLFLMARTIAKRLDKNKYIIVFKKHSSEIWEEGKMDEVLNEFDNWYFIEGYVDIRDVLEMSNIVVGVRSSGILDALPYHKIKVLVLKDIYENDILLNDMSFFDTLCDLGDIIKVNNEDQLYEEVITYNRGKEYRGKINNFWPVDSGKRFRDFIQIFLNGSRPMEEES